MPLLARHRLPSKLAKLFFAMLLACLALVVIGWFFGKPYTEKMLREKLQALVAEQLNARLEIKTIRYRWPYGVQVDEAAFYSTTPGEPSIKLVGFERLDLQLAELPYGDKPLVLETVDVRRPTLYVVETKEHGFVGLEHLFRSPTTAPADDDDHSSLAEVLRLRHVQLTDARIEYDDQTIRKSVPFVWDKLDLRIDGERRSGTAVHYFKGTAGNGDSARIDAAGNIDFDSLVLTLDALNLTTQLTPGQRNSPLPAGVQRVLNTLGVQGAGRATITGNVPLLKTRDMLLTGDFVIDDAQGKLSPEGRPLADLNIDGRVTLKGRDVAVDVQRFAFHRGPFGVSARPVTVNYSIPTDRWSTTPVKGAIAYTPPPGTTGPANQSAVVQVNAELAMLKSRDEFRINFDGTTVTLRDSNTQLRLLGQAKYDDTGITVERCATADLGGVVSVTGFINDTASSFVGELKLENAELASLNKLVSPASETSLKGKVTGTVKGAATDTLDAAKGDGRFRITGGEFGKVPILGGLSQALHVGQNAWVAHEVTGRFTFDNTKLNFSRYAVSTDVLSAVGQGDVLFDGTLKLSLYADGKWKEKPKKDELYIPGLSEIGRAIAGAGAYAFGSISRQFTHFTVTGTTDQPKLTLSPAPVVGESMEKLFKGEEDK